MEKLRISGSGFLAEVSCGLAPSVGCGVRRFGRRLGAADVRGCCPLPAQEACCGVGGGQQYRSTTGFFSGFIFSRIFSCQDFAREVDLYCFSPTAGPPPVREAALVLLIWVLLLAAVRALFSQRSTASPSDKCRSPPRKQSGKLETPCNLICSRCPRISFRAGHDAGNPNPWTQ